MRWSTRTLLYITLAAAVSTAAFAQRGGGGGGVGGHGSSSQGFGGHGFGNINGGLSSTAVGAGASFGAQHLSSTAIGAGARLASPRGGFTTGGYYGSSGAYGTRGNSRGGYGNRDYRNVPYGYFFSPYYYPFLDYGSAPYGGEPEDGPYDPSADTALVTQNLLGEQVQRLTAELQQMQMQNAQQQGPYMPAVVVPQAAAEPAPPPVTVVLRNGQKLQVQNYAVMDHTFWDFSKQPARKIPISTIDISASSEATAANGGDFPELSAQ